MTWKPKQIYKGQDDLDTGVIITESRDDNNGKTMYFDYTDNGDTTTSIGRTARHDAEINADTDKQKKQKQEKLRLGFYLNIEPYTYSRKNILNGLKEYFKYKTQDNYGENYTQDQVPEWFYEGIAFGHPEQAKSDNIYSILRTNTAYRMSQGLPSIDEKKLWFIVNGALKDAKEQVDRDYPTLEAIRGLDPIKRAAINDSILRERLPVFPLGKSELSTYVDNKDGTVSYNLDALFNMDKTNNKYSFFKKYIPFTDNESFTDSTEIGKERWAYDPYNTHGHVKFTKLGNGQYLMEDTYDLQPFRNIWWLPQDIRDKEVLSEFGGTPFKNKTLFDFHDSHWR